MNAHTHSDTCSCGNKEPHRVAERRLFDGVKAELWSDGKVNLGNAVFWMAQQRTVGMEAGWAIMDNCALYTQDEWDTLVKQMKRRFKKK